MFGNRLKQVLTASGYNGSRLAKVMGGNSSKLYQIMRNEISPSVKFCDEISKFIPGINFDYLITGRGTPFLENHSGSERTIVDRNEISGYKDLYEQCRQLAAAKDEVIVMQKRRIDELEKEI